MSGSQRKRVTFADLVSARLPSTTPLNSVTKAENEYEGAESAADGATPPALDSEAEAVSSELPAHEPINVSEIIPEPVSASHNRLSLSDSQSLGDSQSPHDSQPLAVRRAFRPTPASQNDSQSLHDSQTSSDSQPQRDRQPLKEVKGYLKLQNTVVDSLLPTLDVYEQATFIQLYRLSHGFGNYTCKISLPALQTRTGVKPTSMKQAIARLQARGIVEKLAAEIGFGREQGITYWVSPDGRQTYSDWQSPGGGQSPDDHNKRKENIKETISKGRLTPEQIKACPDCHGVGMWYPEGPGKGVARCLHPSLRLKK